MKLSIRRRSSRLGLLFPWMANRSSRQFYQTPATSIWLFPSKLRQLWSGECDGLRWKVHLRPTTLNKPYGCHFTFTLSISTGNAAQSSGSTLHIAKILKSCHNVPPLSECIERFRASDIAAYTLNIHCISSVKDCLKELLSARPLTTISFICPRRSLTSLIPSTAKIMAEVTESHDSTPTDTVMDDGIQFQLPTLHHNPRIHLERLAVFLAFREDFAHTTKATRNSFYGNKKKFVNRRREIFEHLISKPEVSLQLHRMKKKSILAAAEFLFRTCHLSPNSAMNKRFAHLSAEQIQSVEWRASVSLPALKKRIVVMVEFEPVSTRTRSNCEGCQKLKTFLATGDESQLSDKMENMCLCVEGQVSTLNRGNSGANLVGNDDDDKMEMN